MSEFIKAVAKFAITANCIAAIILLLIGALLLLAPKTLSILFRYGAGVVCIGSGIYFIAVIIFTVITLLRKSKI